MKKILVPLLMVSLISGCDYTAVHQPLGGEPVEPSPIAEEICNQPTEDLALYTDVFQNVFQPRCIRCHGPENSFADLNLEDSEQAKVRANSILFSVETGSMPNGPGGPLTENQIELLRMWVAQGALLDHEVEDCHD